MFQQRIKNIFLNSIWPGKWELGKIIFYISFPKKMFRCCMNSNDRFMISQITLRTCTVKYLLSNPMCAQSAAVDLRSNLRHASSSTTGGVSPIPLTKSLNWTRWEKFKSTCACWCKVTLTVYCMGRLVVLNYIFIFIYRTKYTYMKIYFTIFWEVLAILHYCNLTQNCAIVELGTPKIRKRKYKNILCSTTYM